MGDGEGRCQADVLVDAAAPLALTHARHRRQTCTHTLIVSMLQCNEVEWPTPKEWPMGRFSTKRNDPVLILRRKRTKNEKGNDPLVISLCRGMTHGSYFGEGHFSCKSLLQTMLPIVMIQVRQVVLFLPTVTVWDHVRPIQVDQGGVCGRVLNPRLAPLILGSIPDLTRLEFSREEVSRVICVRLMFLPRCLIDPLLTVSRILISFSRSLVLPSPRIRTQDLQFQRQTL